MKEKKNEVPVMERDETAHETMGTEKNGKETAIHEDVEKMKLKYSAKVNVLVEDEVLRAKLHDIISEVVNEAVLTGRAAGVPEDVMKSATESFENIAKNFGCLSDSVRAETYKKLYHNQRIITAHLMSAAQILQLQIGDTESLVIPNPLSLFGAMGNTFVPNP